MVIVRPWGTLKAAFHRFSGLLLNIETSPLLCCLSKQSLKILPVSYHHSLVLNRLNAFPAQKISGSRLKLPEIRMLIFRKENYAWGSPEGTPAPVASRAAWMALKMGCAAGSSAVYWPLSMLPV